LTDLEKIVTLCKRGDKKAQKTLFDTLSPQILGIAYRRYVAGYDLANEVVQLTFIKAFKNIENVNPKKVKGWMRKITVNTALSVLKQEKRSSESVGVESIQKHILHQDHSSDIICLMSGLPLDKRILFNLHAIEGYSFKEVGAMLEISEGNARVKYYRIKKEVQKLLEHYFIEG
jgi:RNA polymerase sigma-70 factor (ECF subfamily)